MFRLLQPAFPGLRLQSYVPVVLFGFGPCCHPEGVQVPFPEPFARSLQDTLRLHCSYVQAMCLPNKIGLLGGRPFSADIQKSLIHRRTPLLVRTG